VAETMLGNALAQRGQFDEALTHYEAALKIQPGAPADNNVGYVLCRLGHIREAIGYYQKALELDPGLADARRNLDLALSQAAESDGADALSREANEFLQQGRLDEAIADYQKAAQIEPASSQIQNNLGAALLQSGAITDAVSRFEAALKDDPGDAEAQVNLGQALLKTGHLGAAVQHWREALQLQPQNVSALNDLAWVLATCPDGSRRDGAQAVELAQRAGRVAGESNPVVLGTLAAAYAEAGRFPEAIAAAQQALPLAQNHPALAAALRQQIKLYQSGLPLRDPSLTEATTHE